MILQNFNLRLADPSYELKIKQTLTIKPDYLGIYKECRGDHRPGQLERRLFGGPSPKRPAPEDTDTLAETETIQAATTKPMLLLYGSNTGTCEGLAQSLANRAVAHGFTAKISTMDSAVDRLPSGEPVIFVTATFEGAPADNAGQFAEWLKGVPDGKLGGVQYAVFGCGHHDWSSTYQKIPKWLDDALENRGATRLTQRGESDVALGTVLDDFDSWTDSSLWPAISGHAEQRTQDDFNGLDIEISPSARVSSLRHDVFDARVEHVAQLSGPGVREKRQIVFRLPSHMTYSTGDYLNVLPVNPPETVSRVLRVFGLPWVCT